MLLTIDVGTTNCKAAAFDVEGTLVASASRPYPVRGKAHGLREHLPQDWWRAVVATIRETVAVTGTDEIDGLGVSGRGAGGVFLDRKGRALASSWLDPRHAPENRAISVAARELAPWALGTVSLGLAARALHLSKQDHGLIPKVSYLGGVKDYLMLRLTGSWVTDASSGPPDGQWAYDVIDISGVRHDALPGILPTGALAGRLTSDAAQAIGLPAGLPVSVGAMDGVCASIGAGCVSDGDACITLGTNAVLRLTSRSPIRSKPDVASFFYRFIDDLWATGGDVASSGAFVQQLSRILNTKSIELLDAEASRVPPGSSGVTCMPFPVGMVSPVLQPSLRASFSGITLTHGPEHMFRAAMEGVACSLRSIRDMADRHGISVESARLTGGGARSASWPQIISSTLKIPVSLVEPFESNRGAAMLLAVALGMHSSVPDAARQMVRVTRILEPVPEETAIYEKVWHTYRRALEESD